MEPWEAERELTEAHLDRLLAQLADLLPTTGPGLAGTSGAGARLRTVGAGWDATVLEVAPGLALRVPRRAMGVPGTRREQLLLPLLDGRLPLPVPAPVRVLVDAHPDHPDDPWPVALVRLLPGTELELLPDAASSASLAADVGRFLAALHAPSLRDDVVTSAAAVGLVLPLDPLQRGHPAARDAQAREVVEACRGLGLDATAAAAAHRLLDRAAALPPPDPAAGSTEAPVLVHGDLHLRHVLVGDDGRASGVIDWGDACVADAAVDLSIAYAAFDGPAREALLAAYGRPVGLDRELRARALAVRVCGFLARHAAAEADGRRLAGALAGMVRAAAG